MQKLRTQLEKDTNRLNNLKAAIDHAEKALKVLKKQNPWMEGHPWVDIMVTDTLKDDYPQSYTVELGDQELGEYQNQLEAIIKQRIARLQQEKDELLKKYEE